MQKDDVLYFSAGILSGGAGALIASELSEGDRFWTFKGAIASSLMAGAIKETIEINFGGWDNRDLGATILGGVTVVITVDLFFGKKSRRKLKRISVGWSIQKTSRNSNGETRSY